VTDTQDIVTAALLVIGDEILSGRTKDRNIGTIADHMTLIGIRLTEVRVVADDEAAIVDAVNQLRARNTYLFTTGGIGPTHDDITADCIAKAFGVPIEIDPRAIAVMQPHYDRMGIEFTAARKRMARMPHGCILIDNSVSIAPGFMLGNVIVMAGVPKIMRAMLEDVTALLRTGHKMHSATVRIARPEGDIATLFAAHQTQWPDVAMGSYPSFDDGEYRTELVLRSTDAERLEHAMQDLKLKLSNL
jgi:molybdenum cofactor synthesis domain-containing protein